jgi:hypothetical protein
MYLIEDSDLERLQQINTRLYAPEPLSPDERRDLANLMDVILHDAYHEPE